MNSSNPTAPGRRWLIALLIAFLLLAISQAPIATAATFTVGDTADRADANPGDGICRTSQGTCTLRAAIQEANAFSGADTITLPAGVYELQIPAVNDDTDLTGDFDVHTPITFIGAGAGSTIVDGGWPLPNADPSARGLDRLFELHPTAGNVTFRDLTLREGYSVADGGAIQNWSPGLLKIENVHVLDSLAGGAGGGVNNADPAEYDWATAPLVMPKSGRVEIVNSTFSGNAAGSSGAAVNNSAMGTVSILAGSRIVDNPGEMIPDPTQVIDPLDPEPIEYVPAPGVYEPGAGAIANEGALGAVGTVRILDSTVSGNFASSNGAGVSNSGSSILVIERSALTGNSTAAAGGGLYTNGGTVTVADSNFADNVADDGGGIYSKGSVNSIGLRPRFTLANSTITHNTAHASGGGMANGGDSFLTITDVAFTGNHAHDAGGGLESGDRANLTVTRVTFADNEANGEGGGAWVGSERLATITDAIFRGNDAGVPTPGDTADPAGANVAGGGGLYTENGPVTITGSTFENNTATEEGGGISIDNLADVTISDTILRNNRAADGGGVENSGTRVTFERMLITNNYAELDGGGIYNSSSGPFTILDTTIQLNSGQNGGGIANAPDNDLIIRRSLIYRNTARPPGFSEEGISEDGGIGGGIFSLADGDTLIENTTISSNDAAIGGGGLFHDADGPIKLVNMTIWRNSAPRGGGIGVVESDFAPEVPPKANVAVIVRNSIIGGSLQGGSCDWYVTSEGGNVDGGGTQSATPIGLGPLLPAETHCFLAAAPNSDSSLPGIRDRRSTTFSLDALADNGGPTFTHALTYGSVAIDSGVSPCVDTDQRGVARPQNDRCDAGAFEFEGAPRIADNVKPDTEFRAGPLQDDVESMAFAFTGSDDKTPAEELQFECRLLETNLAEPPEILAPWDPIPPELWWYGCASPWETPLSEEGLFTFEVRAIDRNGNVDDTPATHIFDGLDTNPPETIIAEKPPLTTSSRTATFSFTGIDTFTPPQFLEFECRLDSSDPDLWLECTNPTFYSNLTSGAHTIEVRAIDGHENIDPTPARYTWTVGQPTGAVNCDLANITLTPVADGWVDEVNPVENYLFMTDLTVRAGATGDPAAGQPLVGQNARALFRFDLPADAPDCALESATLRLYNGSPTDGRSLEAAPLAGTWRESTLTWFNQPAPLPGITPATSAAREGYMEWDVRDHVTGMTTSGVNHGWLIRDAVENDPDGGDQAFLSREMPQDPPDQTLPLLVLRYVADTTPPPAPPVPATTPTTVYCGQVLMVSTLVANDLLGCLGEGLVIGAPNIVVDLDGHSITSGLILEPGEEDALLAGIRNGGHTNVVIRNGTVKGFGYGVHLTSGTTRNIVEEITAAGNALAGIQLFDADDGRNGNLIRRNHLEANGETGIALVSDSENSVVENNTFLSNGIGVYLHSASGHRIEGNEISGLLINPLLDSDAGIVLEVGSSDNELIDNAVSDTGDAGIIIHMGSHRNLVQGSTLYRNGDAGVIIGDSDGNRVIDNLSHQQSDGGVTIGNAHDTEVIGNDLRYNPSGVDASNANNLLVEDNDVSHSLQTGIELGNGVNMVIRGNTANNTGGSGIALEGGAFDVLGNPVGGALIEGNTANENLENGIAVADGGHTIKDNSAYNNAGFGILAGEQPEPGQPPSGTNIDGGGNRASGNREVAQCVGVVCAEDDFVPVSTPDTTAPEMAIVERPADTTGSISARFTFTGADGITGTPLTGLIFECRLDAPADPAPEPEPNPDPEPPDPGAPPEVPELPEGIGWSACVSPMRYEGLAPGAHKFEVRAIDQATNFDLTPATHEWFIDITLQEEGTGPESIAPDTRIVSGPSSPTTSSTATIRVAGSDNSTPGLALRFECRLDSTLEADFAACATTQQTQIYTGLLPGPHTFAVRAIDLRDNVDASPAVHTWTIVAPPPDTTAPAVTITDGPDSRTVLTSASFTFASDDPTAVLTCSVDGGATFAPCASPATFSSLPVGLREFRVRATDPAGNVGAALYTWTIASPPVLTTVFCGQVLTRSTLVRNDLANCPWDGLIIGANDITIDLDGHTIDGVGLAAGIRNDGYDNVTIKNGHVTEFDFGVMLNPGTTGNIVEGMSLESNQEAGIGLGRVPHPLDPTLPYPEEPPPSYQSGVNGNIVRDNTILSNDVGVWLTNHARDNIVHANAIAANSSEGVWIERASYNRIEANDINASSKTGVSLQGASNNTVIGNNLSESGGGIYIGITNAGVAGLPSDDNRIEGNTVVESGEDGLIVEHSDGNELIDNVVRFSNGEGVSLYHATDTLVRGNDLTANKSGIALKNSSHNRLEANDASESQSTGITLEALSLDNELVRNFSSNNDGDGIYIGDETAADAGMLLDGNTTNNNVGFGIHVGKVSHIIKNNTANANGGWGIYASAGSNGRTNIDGGGNRAQDNMGPIDSLTLKPLQCFSVACSGGPPLQTDEIAPDTLILQAPSNPSADNVATFHFSGSDNAGPVEFQCRLDGGAFAPCISPREFAGLSIGDHIVEVRAVDVSGHVDLTPATYSWTVVVQPPGAPETTITSGPDLTTVATSAIFEFAASKRDSTFECRLDLGAWASCSSPKTYTGLAVGAHTLEVRAVHAEGTDATPARYSWTVGSAPVPTTVACGEIIVQSTRLLNDLIGCGGHGLIVGANSITIDLDGHVITGIGLDAGILNNGYDSVTIVNGSVSGFDYGILLNPGASLNVVANMRLEANAEAGIALSDADQGGQGNTIRDNTLSANGHGIALFSNTSNTLVRNNALGANSADGIRLEFSSNNRIENNEVATSGGAGIVMEGGGNNAVIGNELRGNLGLSIAVGGELLPSNGNRVESNSTRGGGGGIGVIDSADNQILYNTARDATGPGIVLELARNTLVRGNDVRSNASGIVLDAATGNRIEANNASGTLGAGIEVGALSASNEIVQNAANGNAGAGIEVSDAAPVGAGNLLDRNVADGNGGDGIGVHGVGHTLTGNNANLNGGWGIYVAASATDGGGNLAAGNVEPAQCLNIACTLGTVPGSPETWIVSHPPATSNSRNASFTYMGSDAGTPIQQMIFECRLDSTNDLAWEDCEYPAEYLNLSAGPHVFEVRAVDPTLLADPTPARYEWTYAPLPAGVAPTATINLAPATETWQLDALFTFSANEPDVTFECKVDLFGWEPCGFEGATYMAQGAFEWGLTETEVGPHTFSVRAIDFEGNVGAPATYTWRLLGVLAIVTAGPGYTPGETPLDPPTGGPVTSSNATIEFIANVADAAFLCSLDLEPFAPCTSPVTFTGLIAGSHELRIIATTLDGLGQMEATVYEWEVAEFTDATPPITFLNRAPANNSSSTIFEFTGVDDLTPPALLRFECRVDSANALDWFACVSPFNLLDLFTYADPQMFPGPHTFEVRAIDMAEIVDPQQPNLEGNVGAPVTYTWTMVADTLAPGTGISAGPPATVGGQELVFEFFGTDNATPVLEVTFECSVDGAPFAACSSPESVQGLPPGPHTFAVRAVDLAGNVDATPATRNFTVVPAPVTTIGSGPAGRIVNGNPPATPNTAQSAVFVFAASQPGSTFECSLDGADFVPCTSPRAYWIVTDGIHEFAVRATNPEGVVEEPAVVYEWLAELGPDVTPPDTIMLTRPSNPSTNDVATFTFTGSDNRTLLGQLVFECALDGTAYNSCTSPQQFSDLTRGSHTLLIRTRDIAGNFDPSPASYTWVVELPPVTTILTGPEEITESRVATFTFQSDVPGSTFQCWLDGVIEACTSPKSYTGLAAGDRLFAVLATAPGGTLELAWAEWEWTIGDTTPPITTISSSPPLETEDQSASFEFTANEPGVTFTCSLDGGEPLPCTSPKTYPFLHPGLHSFTVVAISPPLLNAAGQPVELLYEPVPTIYQWSIVDLEPPGTEIQYGPAITTASPIAYFGVSSDDPTATFQCALDGAAFGACETPIEFTDLAPDAHTLQVRAVDLAGNVDPTPATYAWTIVNLAPNTPAGTNVIVNLPLPAGGNATLTFFEVNILGLTTLDALAGAPPLPAGYVLAGGSYYDINSTAEWTEPATLCLPYNPADFAGEPVRLLHFDGSVWVDVTTTNDPVNGLVCGQPESFSPFALATGSGIAPLASIISAPPNPSSSSNATFTFFADVPDSLITCSIDGLPFAPCDSEITYTHLEEGGHQFMLQAIGPEGQTQIVPTLYEWEVVLGPDTTAPETTITAGPGALTANFVSMFSFAGTDDQTAALELDFECSLDGGPFEGCSAPNEVEVLASGAHTFTVRAVDLAGNVDPTPAVRTWTVVDMSAPETTIDLGPNSETEATSAVFEFTGEEPDGTPVLAFECALDNADFAACASPHEVTGLAPGPHVLLVRARDLAGVVDPSPDFYEWLVTGPVDTTAPDTFVVAAPAAGNSGPDVLFGFASTEFVEAFECALDGSAYQTCEAAHELLDLASGSHTILVRALDVAGNVDPTPASHTWTVLGQPDTQILSGPPNPSGSFSATFVFTSSQAGATFQCSVDGTPYVSCTSPFLAGPLLEGDHDFEVRAVNQFVTIEGEQVVDLTPAVFDWLIDDVVAPETTILTATILGPNDLVEPNSLKIEFTGEDNRVAPFDLEFECALDDGPFEGCSTPHYIPLEEILTGGDHTIYVRASDEIGNVDLTPATYVFETEAEPETTILTGPPAEVDSAEATFTFSSDQPGATFECALDLEPFAPCTSPATFTGIAYGAHQLEVRAVSPLGTAVDLSSAVYEWTSGDLTPPVVTILSGPPDGTLVTTATFTFSADETGVTFLCSLDGSPAVPCESGWIYTGLLAEEHTFEVLATKANLLVEALPAVWTWTVVDETAPETTILAGPAEEIALGTPAVFTFDSNEVDASFECALNGEPFAQCATPADATVEFSGLDAGEYTLTVRAVDPSLNVDASPASHTWTVVGPPLTTILAGPPVLPATAPTSTVTFDFTADQAGVTFQCALDGAAPEACTAPVTYTGLANGEHIFQVAATNSLGLSEVPPAGYEWTVEVAAAPNTPTGTDVSVQLALLESGDSMTVTFGTVSTAGETSVTALSSPPALPFGYLAAGALYYDLSTTAAYGAPVTVCLAYSPTALAEPVRLLHFAGSAWVDITTTVDAANGVVCGETASLSPFAIVTAVELDTVIESGPPAETVSTVADFFFSSNDPAPTFQCSLDALDAWGSCPTTASFAGLAVGSHTLWVRAVNAAGVDATPASFTWIVLPLPETVIVSGPPTATESIAATFVFTSDLAGATFQCALDADSGPPLFETCSSPANYVDLPFGEYTFLVRAADAAGNVDPTPAEHEWSIGDIPAPVTITSGPDATTESRTATFAFTADETSPAYACALDSGAYAPCTSPKTYTGLPLGPHTFQVRVFSPTALVEPPIATYTWTVADLTPPDTTIAVAPPAVVSTDAAVTVSFSSNEASATFQCALNGAAFASCELPAEFNGLAPGDYTFSVRAVDGSGNVDQTPASTAWSAVAPPDTTIDVGPTGLVTATTVTLTFASNDLAATFECALDGGPFTACTTPHAVTGLADGRHTILVRARIAANIADATPAEWTWTIDLAPETTIISGPPVTTNSTSASFILGASEPNVTFACAVDGAAFAACNTPHTVNSLTVGSHTFAVRATDAAGTVDATPAAYNWTVVNTEAGVNVIVEIAMPDGVVGEPATVAFAEVVAPGETTVAVLNSPPALPATYLQLDALYYDINTTATFSGEVTVCLSYAPASFANPGALQLLHFDNGAWTDATTTNDTANGLICGTVASLSPFAMTLPDTPPDTSYTLLGTPSATSTSKSAVFRFVGNDDVTLPMALTYVCRLDGVSIFAPCTSPAEVTDLSEGAHTFEVWATDAAGNSDPSPASFTWVIDSVATDTTILSKPDLTTTGTAAAFTFTAGEGNATFECALDGGAFAACTAPVEFAGLGQGPHTFAVRAIDAAGNIDPSPASYGWVIDSMAPNTVISGKPDPTTASTDATFTFAADEAGATFTCSLNGAEFAPCASPAEYNNLALAVHEFRVRATDLAGNMAAIPASYTWTIAAPADTTPPETEIQSGPANPTTATDATFTFGALEPNVSFVCRLNGQDMPCTSPWTYTGLSVGVHHSFAVWAIDVAGNADPMPANYTWLVAPPADTTPPETLLNGAPADNTPETGAAFSFAATEAGVTFECALDNAPFTSCGSPQAYGDLSVGAHSFAVRAIDAAGNVDPTPAPYAWTIVATADTTPPETTLNAVPAATTTTETAASFTFAANETGVTFECALDNAPFTTCVAPQAHSGLSVGAHSYAVRAIDAAGNVDPTPASYAWTIVAPADTTAPETTLDAVPAATTTETTAGFSFSANEAGATFACSLDGASFVTCASPQTYTGLGVGGHSFAVRAVDTAGNSDPTPTTFAWTVSPPLANCNVSTTVSASADAWIDQGSKGSNKGSDSILKVQSKSSNNNLRTLVRFSLPSLPPGCQVASATLKLYAASAKNGRTIQVFSIADSWTENKVTWNNQPNTTGAAATAASGSGWREWAVGAQVQGMYTTGASHGFLIRDAAENSGSNEQQFHAREKRQNPPQLVISFAPAAPPADTAPPETILYSAWPVATTTETGAGFVFAANEAAATFACSLDGSAFAACTSPVVYTGLPVGSHTFQVQATDPAGNVDPTPVTYGWTIVAPPDTTAPETAIDAELEATTSSTAATFTLAANETGATFSCSLDGSAFAACAASVTYTDLALGQHTFQVQATDLAGNVDPTPASYTWTIVAPPDTTAPETTIDTGPEATTISTEATFTFTADEAVAYFECSLDGSAFATCTAAAAYHGLPVGQHTFQVRAVDLAGNIDQTPASYTWVVEAAPTPVPTAVPTEEPTAVPTEEPTAAPTAEPTPVPTEEPTPVPTGEPTAAPTEEPTTAPTEEPTTVPTEEPTVVPTEEPTTAPTAVPTAVPTEEPTTAPTEEPTTAPTEAPTAVPTEAPTAAPTEEPTAAP